MHRNLGVFTGRGLDLDVLFRQLLGQRGRRHRRARPHVPLRRARPPDRRHDQPPRGDAAGGRRPGAGGAAARRGPGGRRLHRRRRDQRGRLPRGAEPGGRLAAAGPLRHREQPVRPVDADIRAVRLRRPRRPGRRLRHARRRRRRQRRARGAATPSPRAAARARGGAGPTLLECKTFRMRGHEEASGTDYVPAERSSTGWRADPIARFERPPRRPGPAAAGRARGAGRRAAGPRSTPGRRTRWPRPSRPPPPRRSCADVYAPAAPCAEPATPTALAGAGTATRDALRRRDRDGLREAMRR